MYTIDKYINKKLNKYNMVTDTKPKLNIKELKEDINLVLYKHNLIDDMEKYNNLFDIFEKIKKDFEDKTKTN